MKRLLLVLVMCLICSVAGAAEYEMRPRFMDIDLDDGIMDAGSYSNPYVIEDSLGRERATVRPRMQDIDPGDGIMDAGTYSNPFIVDFKGR